VITIAVYTHYIGASARLRRAAMAAEPRVDQHAAVYFQNYTKLWSR
jgi:hypothetical protein